MPPMRMSHEIDPKQKILEQIGDLSKIEIFNNQVLIALYIRPNKTKSGIILTDKYVDEDLYQSKIGLIVKKGPTSFQDETGNWFKGEEINVGDWVFFRPSDGWNISVNETPCRIVPDVSIKGRTDHPDTIW